LLLLKLVDVQLLILCKLTRKHHWLVFLSHQLFKASSSMTSELNFMIARLDETREMLFLALDHQRARAAFIPG